MCFYEKLLQHKKEHSLTWGDIGSVLENQKEQTTMRLAVKNQSLTKYEILDLEEKLFGVVKEKKSPIEEAVLDIVRPLLDERDKKIRRTEKKLSDLRKDYKLLFDEYMIGKNKEPIED